MLRTILLFFSLLALPSPAGAQIFGVETWQFSAVAVLAAAWLAFAVWAVIRSARIRTQADMARAWGLRLRALLATAPDAYLIVGDDDRVVASDGLRAWLQIDRKVSSLAELGPQGTCGIEASSMAELEAAIEAAALSGSMFNLSISLVKGMQTLEAHGRPAPPELAGDKGVVVWFADTTELGARVETLEAMRRAEASELLAARAVLMAAPMPVWRRASDLSLTDVNLAYAEAVDAGSPEEAVAAGTELVANPLSPGSASAAAAALESGEPQQHEETVVFGGLRRRLRIHEVPLANGQVAGFALDVSEREDARAELARFAAAQTDMLDRLSAGVARFSPERTLIFSNRAFMRIFLLDEDMIAAQPEFDRVLEHMREARRLPEQRDFPNWKMARREWFQATERSIEETWVLPDNMVLRVIAQPAPDGGLLMIFEDQSERIRLASSRDQLMRVQEATLSNLHEAVSVFGANGRLQFWNRAFQEIWQTKADRLADKPSVDQLFADSGVQVRDGDGAEIMRSLIQGSTAGRTERSGRLELSNGRFLKFASVPLPDGNALITFIDVTDAERIEMALRDRNDALEAADEAKNRFVENMSYELRTPLTSIAGFGEMLSQGLAGEMAPQQRDYVDSILESAERLRHLIDGILDLAVSKGDGVVLDKTEFPVRQLLSGVAAMVEREIADRGLVFESGGGEDSGEIIGDPVRLKQALFNLASNAMRFTPEGGRICLDVEGSDAGVTLIVKDTGVGIPKDEHDLVFERFRKASNAPDAQGVGLGLSLVREIVDLHGGRVTLESALGEGTEVRLWLPRRGVAVVRQSQNA